MSNAALIDAIKRGDLESVKTLIESEESINQEDDAGWTALNWAAAKGQIEIVKLLLDRGADVLKMGRDLRTPYKTALASGHVEVSRVLREAETNARGDDSSYSQNEYCRAYSLKDLRQFSGWPQDQPVSGEQEKAGNVEDAASSEEQALEEETAFLHHDFTVTKWMWRNEDVIFAQITPEWKDFCLNVLNFKVSDDLDLIVPAEREHDGATV
jgi:ankyrin repeat protein